MAWSSQGRWEVSVVTWELNANLAMHISRSFQIVTGLTGA